MRRHSTCSLLLGEEPANLSSDIYRAHRNHITPFEASRVEDDFTNGIRKRVPPPLNPPSKAREDEVADFINGALNIVKNSLVPFLPCLPNNYVEDCPPHFFKE